ncbi:MAG TPA: Stp1/IreP family PP2C-type Ser/Thr phosphatase [Acidimicrobiales bacterium]|nr:Stp1/IreP family PP2C-type Ser/Thr phosphatase [Acidimicrobiales bacterium]
MALDVPFSRSDDRESGGKEEMPTLKCAARTDIGRERENNEDAVVNRDNLAAVADGMGGAPGGEIASAAAATLVESAFTGSSLDELTAAARAANRTIWDRARTEAGLEGMGTTLCAVGLLETGSLAVVNVGDSRAYLWRGGSLRRLTDDHSITAELLRRGEITEEEAVDHPHRHILTRALGVAPTVEVDGCVHPVQDGDRLVLCTDGLFTEVQEEEIASVMATDHDIAAAKDSLVELALSRGGHDNISVVVADVRT